MYRRDNTNYQRRERRPIVTICPYCEQGTIPDYKDYRTLRGLVTDKGKIQARNRTGICMLHQRWFTTAVKRARYMALLPFVATVR